MKFAYLAFDHKGIKTAGEVEAGSLGDATEQLRRKSLFVSEIKPAIMSTNKAGSSMGAMRSGKRLKYLAMFSRQLQVLISSGTPLVQALAAIERQIEDPNWKSTLETLRNKVEEGTALSEAMRGQPGIFDPVCLSLIAAGEASGDMGAMLERMAALYRKQLQLRNVIAGTLVYPCLLIVLGVVVLILMLMFVLPRFGDLFKQLNTALPPTTKILMWMSERLWNDWWIIIPGVVGSIAGSWLWILSDAGRKLLDDWVLKIPKIGKIYRSLMTARLSRMLGVLLESRVVLLDALHLTKASAKHLQYIDLLTRAENAVGRGEAISAVLCETDLINPAVQEAIRTGEMSGRLGTPLIQMADFLDEENDVIIKSLTSLIEPAILVVLGVLVGGIALSMFLPLFDLVASTQQGGH